MPIISIFYGIVIQMYCDEHAPPHFHAQYAEYEILVDIQTLDVIRGTMPKRARILVLEWACEHRSELLEDWLLCEAKKKPKKIQPLT